MKIPRNINVGDKIGIISPARKISFLELSPAIKILESWGLKVILAEAIFEEDHQFSATIAKRTSSLQVMINDNSIKAILCARGGYGTVQIIDKINFTNLQDNPKWIIGYSDITVLHSHLHQLGVATIHATMPVNFQSNTNASLQSLQQTIFRKKNIITCTANKYNILGSAEAEVVGGNLSILYSLLGSESDLDTTGKILFIEDLDEYLYHIDRMMINLKRNGKFKYLKGMIIGGMMDMKDNPIQFGRNAHEIILSNVEEYNFPICFGFPSGHIDDNRSIILGVKSTLNVKENDVNLSQYL